MPFRFVGTVDGQSVTFLLPEGKSLLGSSDGCELQVEHATVSRRHAEIVVEGRRVVVRDNGSRNGTWVDGKRVVSSELDHGARVAFGKVRLTLEEVSQQDVALGMRFNDDYSDVCDVGTALASTAELRSVDSLVLETLPGLLQRLEQGADELDLARAAAGAFFARLPAQSVKVVADEGAEALLYEAHRDAQPDAELVQLVAHGRELRLIVELPHPKLAEVLQPLALAVASAMRLAAPSSLPAEPAEPRRPPPLPEPPTVSPIMRRIYTEAAHVAKGDVGVLVCGESGTGKDVLASYVHAASEHASGPFVALNCAAVPENLLEAELFGIERGVATGVERRAGKFELAHQGTLFLDEIADMPADMQAKILRVLQEGEVFRLGASKPLPARCRIIAATNRDIDALRSDGRFREDLYYRIATWVVELPPLRHRRQDIPNLAAHFLWTAARQRGIRVKGITQAALQILTAYHWPGNIRQLQNEMLRVALFLGNGEALDSGRLSPEMVNSGSVSPDGPLEERLHNFERNQIENALQRAGGIASAAADELGIGRSTLYRRMRALAINPDDSRRD